MLTQIEAREFRHMPRRIAILSPKDSSNLVDLFKVGRHAHLLGQLRRLGKECWPAKVLDFEDGGTRLGGTSLELRRVNLDEASVIQVVSEELADAGLYAEDGLGAVRPEIDNAVVQAVGLG